MIAVVSSSRHREAAALVAAALRRSVSYPMVMQVAPAALAEHDFVVAISPDELLAKSLTSWLAKRGKRKVIIFGSLPGIMQKQLGFEATEFAEEMSSWTKCDPAPIGGFSASAASIEYGSNASVLGAGGWSRPCQRFDFADEWNNLGYGAIHADGSIWSLSDATFAPAGNALASVVLKGRALATYSALFDDEESSIFWVNRPVGMIDSFEWNLIEKFISDYRSDGDFPCRPVLSEVPYGYDCAVTMRLDCDEDIKSADYLWQSYRAQGIPLSLAIHTTNLAGSEHHQFLRDFRNAGGAILSHTATHAPNWGGSYEAALQEGLEARDRIAAVIGEEVAYAVSPFHQSPPYALSALCDAGYSGCIGGIIRNDPEFLIARGGEIDGLPRGFIGHSQQCMLHGDCMLEEGDPIAVYKAAFDRAFETRILFGFLDHPFSSRYQYGWPNEELRAQMHGDLIAHIKSKAQRPLFMNEIEAMDFLRARASVSIRMHNGRFVFSDVDERHRHDFCVRYQGALWAADAWADMQA